MLLGITEVSKELRVHLPINNNPYTYSLHATSTLALRSLNTILVVLDTLVAGCVMLLLHHAMRMKIAIIINSLALSVISFKQFSSTHSTYMKLDELL